MYGYWWIMHTLYAHAYVWLFLCRHVLSVLCMCAYYLCVVIVKGTACEYVICTVWVWGRFIYLSLFEDVALWETQNKFYCKPRATEGLREPKPSIRAGHIPHMQTNELEHSPPTGPTTQRSKIRCEDVRRDEGMQYNKMKIRKPSCGAKVKGQANIRINEE